MTNSYVWTDNSMLNDVADENPSITNENLMHLKSETNSLYNYGVPFSVNYGLQNSSGYAGIMNRTSTTSLQFNNKITNLIKTCGGIS